MHSCRYSIINNRIYLIILGFIFISQFPVWAAPGDWPQPRQNQYLTAIQPLPGDMINPPEILGKIELCPTQPAITQVNSPDGTETWGLCIVGGALYCFDTQGHQKWVSHPPQLNYWGISAAEDLNGDGKTEILLTTGRPTNPYAAATLVSLENGELLWRYDVEPMSYAWYLYADHYFPNDDSKQIIVLMQGYPPDKDNGYIALFDFENSQVDPKQIWRYDFHQYTCFPPLMQTDLDGDGIMELAIISHSRMWLLDVYTGKVKQFIQWDVSPGNSRSYGLDQFVDLNGDGLEDFLCIADFAQHHEVLLNKNGKFEQAWAHGWSASVMTGKIATTYPVPPYADVDGDGKLEIIVSMFNAEDKQEWVIRIYDSITGDIKYRIPGATAIAAIDCDGDNAAEIGAHLSGDPTQTTIDGAELIDIVNGQVQIPWKNKDARFIKPRLGANKRAQSIKDKQTKENLCFTLNGRIYELAKNKAGEFQKQTPPPPTPREDKTPRANFSLVPDIKSAYIPKILSADLTSDGRNEILIYGYNTLRVFDISDKGIVSELCQYQSTGQPAIADLNGDGHLEIITGEITQTAQPIVEARTPALNNKILWRSVYPKADREGLPWTSRPFYARIGKFTGKETPDVYVWTGLPLVRSVVLDGLSGQIVWERGDAGSGRYHGPTHNLTSVYDYNGDGKEDLCFTNPDQVCIADGSTGNFLLGPLTNQEIFKQPSSGLYTLPAILLNNQTDPFLCIIAGHYFQGVMSINAKPMWYQLPPAGESRSGPEGFLQLPDGSWVMGFGRENGKFACVDVASGNIRWEIDLKATCAETLTLDVDGDGNQEFVVATSHNECYVIADNGGQPKELWRCALPAGAGLPGYIYPAGIGAPIAADINADQKSEIIIPLCDGNVYILGARH